MTEIKNKSIQNFLNELASKSATPGGGSVSALLGAQSAALTSMVCNLTIGKPKYSEVEIEMQAVLIKSENLREILTGLIKADIDVFDQLMLAYGLPKDTDDEKGLRAEVIQRVLKAATEVPLDCARACAEAIELSRCAANIGNLGAISDAGAAVMVGYSGLKIAALNVYINTGNIKDKQFVDDKLAELSSIMNGIELTVEDIYQLVKNKL
ncbi:MAG: cyclodeaminase/cyclohydrolase family protein [Methylococcales bacterium]|jgi:formiminotetrahydrofolate cyclodeaminase|nr:cyclodeaminase/cyclohydrolase family protein [Methylococcales bacterium]